jgi:hypothetical protein
MSLISKVASFARSRQGRAAFGKAKRYAQSPQGREKIEQARRQLSSRGGGPRKRPPR